MKQGSTPGSGEGGRSSIRSRLIIALSVAAAMLVMTAARAAIGSYSELHKAELAERELLLKAAVDHYGLALEWYVPGLPAMARARQGLLDLGRRAEEAGDEDLALAAFSTLRSSLYASRSFYTPGRDLIAVCDEKIAGLMAQTPDALEYHPDLSQSEREALFKSYMGRFPGPGPGWAALAEVGFIAWIASAALFLLKAGRPRARIAPLLARWLPLFVAGYALWLTSLYWA